MKLLFVRLLAAFLSMVVASCRDLQQTVDKTVAGVAEFKNLTLDQVLDSPGTSDIARKLRAEHTCYFQAFSGGQCETKSGVGGKIELEYNHHLGWGEDSQCIDCNDRHSFKLTGDCPKSILNGFIRLHEGGNCNSGRGHADAEWDPDVCYNVNIVDDKGNGHNWRSARVMRETPHLAGADRGRSPDPTKPVAQAWANVG